MTAEDPKNNDEREQSCTCCSECPCCSGCQGATTKDEEQKGEEEKQNASSEPHDHR